MSTPATSVLGRALADVGSAAWLLARSAREAVAAPDRDRLAQALATYFWRPLPALVLVGALAGLLFGLPMSDLVRMVRGEQVVGTTMSVIIVREVVPVLVGILAAGRIAADLALRLAVDEDEALAGPRALAPALVAIVLAAPIHVCVTTISLWLTIGALMQNGPLIPWPTYVELTMGPPIYAGLWIGVIKAELFTLVAAGVAAAAGSRVFAGRLGEVGRARAAFTAGLIGVLAAAALWAWLR